MKTKLSHGFLACLFILLPETTSFGATGSLYEKICSKLQWTAFDINFSDENLKKVCDTYETKIFEQLQQLKISLMRDLLIFLKQDARSLEAIKRKIHEGGYEKATYDYRARCNAYFDMRNFIFQPLKDILNRPNKTVSPEETNTRWFSPETLNIFQKTDESLQQFAEDCAITNAVRKLPIASIIYEWYNNEKGWYFRSFCEGAWLSAANASGGWWSMLVHCITTPHSMTFSPKGTQNFINLVTKQFNTAVDTARPTDDAKDLKENLKKQFRDNFFEYMLRGIYNSPPSTERNSLIEALLNTTKTRKNNLNNPSPAF